MKVKPLCYLILMGFVFSCAGFSSSQTNETTLVSLPLINVDENPIGYYEQQIMRGNEVEPSFIIEKLTEQFALNPNTAPEWTKQLALAESLYHLEAITDQELHQTYINYALFIADKASPGVALAMVETFFQPNAMDNNQLQQFFNLAIKHLSLNPLMALKTEMDKRGMDTLRAEELRPQSRTQWMKGTVMVYVDKGFKRQGPISIPQTEIGSGFFIDRSGYLLTNYHVISSLVDSDYKGPTARLYIQLWNSVGERLPATVVGYNKTTDLALLKVAYTSDYVFSFDTYEELTLGEPVYALGAPAGFSFTLTQGLVSNASRALMPIGDVVQIDAAINPGNSGGPLVTDKGSVVGIVFAGIEQFEGLNFALPANMVRSLLPKMAFKGEASIPFLALSLYDWGNSNLELTFISGGTQVKNLGLKEGDTLKAVGKLQGLSRINLQKQLLKLQPNSLITLEWVSNNQNQKALAVLKERPKKLGKYLLRHNTLDKFYAPLFGLAVKNINSRQFMVTKVYPGTMGSQHNFNRNDTFVFIRREKTNLEDDLLALRIQNISKPLGVMEDNYGFLLYSPFENNSFL